jgi:hypothetical protein
LLKSVATTMLAKYDQQVTQGRLTMSTGQRALLATFCMVDPAMARWRMAPTSSGRVCAPMTMRLASAFLALRRISVCGSPTAVSNWQEGWSLASVS